MSTTATRLDELFEQCRDLADDLNYEEANRWKGADAGRKILGHFQVYFPEEIAYAGNLLPIKIVGGGNKLEAKSADAHIGSFICSIMRSSLELVLNGRLSFLDGMITHPICDAARHIAGIWARAFPDQPVQILYLPQNPNSEASTTYLYREYRRLRAELEEMCGHPISDEDLKRCIALYNENRRLLRELYAIRKETPWIISSVELHHAIKAGCGISVEMHNELLQSITALLRERETSPQDKVRVVLSGAFCELPPLEMIEAIEELCYVVDDDFLIGLRWLIEDVAIDGDPLWNLAHAYIHQSTWASTQYDSRKPKEWMLANQVRDGQAKGVICSSAKFCEPALDDQIAFAKHLDQQDIPYILVEFEEKQTSFERLKMQVETFAESILFE